MRRLSEMTGLVPVEYPTTPKTGATPADRAADISAAFADPAIRAILTVVGGDDQITVIPHLDAGLARRDPSRSSATATTPTCTRGCGRTASPASTAGPPKCT
jgi:hypothetical protein